MWLVATILENIALDSYSQLVFEISIWIFLGISNLIWPQWTLPRSKPGLPIQHSINQTAMLLRSTPWHHIQQLFPLLPPSNPSASSSGSTSKTFPISIYFLPSIWPPIQATCHLDNSNGLFALFLLPLLIPFNVPSTWQPEWTNKT